MAAKPSKFSTLFEAPQEPEETIEQMATEAITPVSAPDTAVVIVTPKPVPAAEPPAAVATSRTTTGKKSDPRYKQVTAYVRKDLHRHVTDALYDESRGREDAKRKEFSELVDELLDQWLQTRQGTDRHNGEVS